MANKYDFDLIKGETFSQRVIIRDENNNYMNLSGYSLTGYGRYSYCSTGILLNLNPTIHAAVSGMLDLTIHYTGTLGIPTTKIPYDLNAYIGATSENLLYGYIYVYPGIVGTSY